MERIHADSFSAEVDSGSGTANRPRCCAACPRLHFRGERPVGGLEIGLDLFGLGRARDDAGDGRPCGEVHGFPVTMDGATATPGLYFVGVHFLRKRKSSLLYGVGEDAEVVVRDIAARRREVA